MKIKAKDRRRLEALCLELASEAELETVADLGTGEQQREARRLCLERAREMARRAARVLTASLDRVWPDWRVAP